MAIGSSFANAMKKIFYGKKEQPSGRPSIVAVTTTKVVVKCDVGFGRSLFIRGQGAGLNWEKGTLMENRASDEWEWQTTSPFEECEFKVLIDDQKYENGDNHRLYQGATVRFIPQF